VDGPPVQCRSKLQKLSQRSAGSSILRSTKKFLSIPKPENIKSEAARRHDLAMRRASGR